MEMTKAAPRDASYAPPADVQTIVAGTVATDAKTDVMLHQSEDVLRWAIENRPGTTVVEDGAYKVGKVRKAAGGQVVSRRRWGARIEAGGQDTISFFEHGAIQPLTLRGFMVDVSPRAGIINSNTDEDPLRLNLEHCLFDGMYNHAKRQGPESKWGMQVYRWDGYAAYSTFQNIKREHGIYDHSAVGDERVILECDFKRCGRTGYQHVGREGESGYSDAVLKLTRSTFEDCGLRDGGSHITVQGMKAAVIKGCESYIGRDEAFARAWLEANPGRPAFGTGHFVNWTEWEDGEPRNRPSELIAFQDWRAWTRPSGEARYGHAPSMQVKNAAQLHASGKFHVAEPWGGVSMELGDEILKPGGVVFGDDLDLRVQGSIVRA